MAYSEVELRASLTLSVPVILDSHYRSLMRKDSDLDWFIESHKELLDSSFTTILLHMIEALYMNAADYGQFLDNSHSEGIQQGIFLADIFGEHFDIMMEMSKDLNLTAQNIMFGIIEEKVDDSVNRLFFNGRLMECNWVRFTGFAQGYLSNKNEEIDSLHEQKIAVMGQMAAGMAHEIRNPLASIKGFAQLIHNRLNEPEIKAAELRTYLDITIKEIDNLNRLVTDFLVLSRKGDSLQRDGEIFNVIEVIHRVVNIVNQLILSDNIVLNVDCSAEQVWTLGSASQLEQVFLNILKNSIDAFTALSGRIDVTITTQDETDEIILIFTDNGAGIPKDKLNRIFDPFFTTKQKGTGIGLSICKQLIEMYGGQIQVNSEIKVGTSVKVSLPWVSDYAACMEGSVS
ncbi:MULTISPECIES: ATP-binding protein [unclassified Paenibacillus]|uniref:sensor histidine kinase n=1 Tax=unclassified Paenibacillus TaxID=185978 RepID=UPI0024074B2C|nr:MULTISPECIES: ATP-binding protein [unclassified Paenibacillus]MDF9841660.1 signal transduction histidine kinase [Paenibacillus sp. PastF-2]MDF9848228.1 signal transduction histidine kinase [Paenibacillus sp. PastM-2]MDF9854819.1 signal transduction histidine kinase [Paenibacillus sp. PastF-1]MDH6480089.1 signal transduction histidine kinase [Paenibacillus sp. PastH-2]MDH6507522.1 signal transduction histidine kinase [Paenibacillus sp. PastM-3]